MSTITIGRPVLRYYRGGDKFSTTKIQLKPSSSSFNFSPIKLLSNGATTTSFFCSMPYRPHTLTIRASSSETALAETSQSTDFSFKQTFPLSWTQTCEGKIIVRLENLKDQGRSQLTVGCSLPGKWLLHWGVSYVDDVGSEWDQPPKNMRPPASVPIKDYAIETPLKKSSESDTFHEVKINLDPKSSIAAINFVLKDEETGAWYQHKGRDFKVPLVDYLIGDGNVVGAKKGFNIWPGSRNHY